MIVVDSSVWIDFINDAPGPHVETLHGLLGQQPILIGDIMLTEILQGLPSDAHADRALALLSRFLILPMVGRDLAIKAATRYRELRRKGITIRQTVDMWIATWCIENQVPLLHNDRDFSRMAENGLPLLELNRESSH